MHKRLLLGMQALILNHAKEATMFRFRIRLGLALALVVVLAAALMPAAGAAARGIQPTSPWYAYHQQYDAALMTAQHQPQKQRRELTRKSIQLHEPLVATRTTPHSGTRSTSGSSRTSANRITMTTGPAPRGACCRLRHEPRRNGKRER